ncbi:unnamed protein product [Porites evermanni]|uniref:Uncharacterized protein n=1 Tax=Porites evermanni TaxID=104178 RepID=A0ABN8MHW6_9CNID|nr:unnamed protein product [Porites evermanni]
MSLWPTDPNNHMDQSQRHRSSPLLSRHNRTRELEINRADPKRLVALDTQFLKQLRQLPDQLEQLKRHFDSGTKSTSRFEAWNDHAQYQQSNTREENLKREHEEK